MPKWGWRSLPFCPSLQAMSEESPDNDNRGPVVMLITGRAGRRKDGETEGIHILLVAPDEDTAVKRALEALAAEGYVHAELDQIGDMDDMPDEEPHASAWQGAVDGEISIITFREDF